MGGVPILLALAAVTVDYGYQPDGKGGVEYVIQVTPEEFEYAKRAGEISSIVDPSVRGRVSRFVVRVGTGPLPRDAGTPEASEAGTVAQAQALDARADQSFVPIPEMRDPLAAAAAAPIPADESQASEPVSRAKPQENAGYSFPPSGANDRAAGDDSQDPAQDALRRLNAGPTGNPAAGPNYSGPGYSGPTTANQTNSGPATASSDPGLQPPSTSPLARDNNWNREPSANRDIPSTTPRTGSTAAAGNFGAPAPGVSDPRLSSAAASAAATAPQQYAQPPASQTPTAPGDYNPQQNYNPNQYANQYSNPPQYNRNTYDSSEPNQYEPARTTQYDPARQATAGSYVPQSNPAVDPRANNGYANGPDPRLASNAHLHQPAASTVGPRQPADYERGAELEAAVGSFLPSERVTPTPGGRPAIGRDALASVGGSGLGEEESRGLPQQVFNGLLLLSLVANAYLIIQMSKLIQRYRDLRVNLRTATAGKSGHTPAAA